MKAMRLLALAGLMVALGPAPLAKGGVFNEIFRCLGLGWSDGRQAPSCGVCQDCSPPAGWRRAWPTPADDPAQARAIRGDHRPSELFAPHPALISRRRTSAPGP